MDVISKVAFALLFALVPNLLMGNETAKLVFN